MNLIPFKEKELWGYIDIEGNIKITPQYFKAENFQNGFALVCPTKHRSRELYSFNNETEHTYNGSYDELWGLINSNGEYIIKPNYKYLKVLSNNFASGILYAGPGKIWNDYCQNKNFAIQFDDKESIELGRFNEISLMSNGFCLLKRGRDPVGKDYCWASYKIIDKKGNCIIEFGGGNSVSEFENGYIKIGYSIATDGVWGFETLIYDSEGELIIKLPLNINNISKNLGGYYIYEENDKYFTLNVNDNNKITEVEYEIDLTSDGLKSKIWRPDPSY